MVLYRESASQTLSSSLTMPLRRDTLQDTLDLTLTKQAEEQDRIIDQIGEWPKEVYHEKETQPWFCYLHADGRSIPFKKVPPSQVGFNIDGRLFPVRSQMREDDRLDGAHVANVTVRLTRSRPRTPRHLADRGIIDGYSLPGEGNTKENCGRAYAKVWCPTCEPDKFKFKKELTSSCFARDCPVCARDWLKRQTERLTDRLYQLSREVGRFPRHVVLSPPKDLAKLSVPQLKKHIKPLLALLNATGCLVIFHPWRFRSVRDGEPVQWKHASLNPNALNPVEPATRVYSPHFHLLAFGFLKFSKSFAQDSGGWIYKNLDDKKSATPKGRDSREKIFTTIYYQLTHAGIHQSRHTYSLHGICHYSYWKKVQTSQDEEPVLCEVCGGSLKTIRLLHDGSLSDTIEDYVQPCSFSTFEWQRKPPWLGDANG